MVDYNPRFAKPPANQKDLHRPLRAATISTMRLLGKKNVPCHKR
jgi:hypothetical protein